MASKESVVYSELGEKETVQYLKAMATSVDFILNPWAFKQKSVKINLTL